MFRNDISHYIFDIAAAQNSAIADNLNKIASRSGAKDQERFSKIIALAPTSLFNVLFGQPDKYTDEIYIESFGIDFYSGDETPKWHALKIRSLVGFAVLIAGIIAVGFVVRPSLYDSIIANWKYILLAMGGICIGSGCILLFGRIGNRPLKNLVPPDGKSDQPLKELEQLASRTVSRLKTAYRVHIFIIFIVAILLLFIVLWSIYMISLNKIEYAAVFGSSGIGMLVLSKWKWQPFERMAEARKLADGADALAMGLRLRIESISEIEDPEKRAIAQWEAVKEYLQVK